MAKIKVRRTHRDELPGVAVLRDAVAGALDAYPAARRVLDLDMDVDPDLTHLMTHDTDGFFTAIEGDQTLGFAAGHVRLKQCVLSELWVLPQHHGKGAGEALLNRVLSYGERFGAKAFLAVVPTLGSIQSLLLRHDFAPITPIYVFQMTTDQAAALGHALANLLGGRDVTNELIERRGQADLDRIDKLTRGVTREVDHVHWLKVRRLRAAFVTQSDRVTAYAYGGPGMVGPAAGATQAAAVSALGWSLQIAARHSRSSQLYLRVPAAFTPAVEALHDGGARLHATLLAYGRGVVSAWDRCLLGSASLP